MLFKFSDENKLVDMQVTIKYSTVEECNEHLEKVKAYYTKKYGKPTTKKIRVWWTIFGNKVMKR